jgi:hypothetical protein
VRGCITAGLSVPVGGSYCVSHAGLTFALGDDKATLEREIDVIQTLLDEQPDSKCECPVVYYLRIPTDSSYRVYGVVGRV